MAVTTLRKWGRQGNLGIDIPSEQGLREPSVGGPGIYPRHEDFDGPLPENWAAANWDRYSLVLPKRPAA